MRQTNKPKWLTVAMPFLESYGAIADGLTQTNEIASKREMELSLMA